MYLKEIKSLQQRLEVWRSNAPETMNEAQRRQISDAAISSEFKYNAFLSQQNIYQNK